MYSRCIQASGDQGLSTSEMRCALQQLLDSRGPLRRVLLLPPDFTRFHSNAGLIVRLLWELLEPRCRVDIMPALGTHAPVTEAQWRALFGEIPYARMIVHDWRSDVVEVGVVPGEEVARLSDGLLREPIRAEVNRRLLDPDYDLILSIGQVVPHEIVGMANRNKNVFVGCGGPAMINASHMMGALYGMERIMGRDHTPVRDLFDYAEARFLTDIPLCYILTVTTAAGADIRTHGLFIGRDRAPFEAAVALSQRMNLTLVDRPFQKAVVWLDPTEFKSTWLGNKAVYRTRMAMADGGELVIIAPGVGQFGEDPDIDALVRKYGYCGREAMLRLSREQADLRENLSAAAHIIHGSSDGRFRITYCPGHLSREEITGVGYGYMPLEAALARYKPDALADGWNTLPDGEEIFFIPNPALGLWADRRRF